MSGQSRGDTAQVLEQRAARCRRFQVPAQLPQTHFRNVVSKSGARKKGFARAPFLQVRVISCCDISRTSKTGACALHYLRLLAAPRRFRGASMAGLVLAGTDGLTLAGNRDVLVAAGAATVFDRRGYRAGYLVGVKAPIGRGLGEIPRLAVGMGGVGAAFVASRQALVDAIAIVGRIGNDENVRVRPHR